MGELDFIEDHLKNFRVGCSDCNRAAPFTLREWEEGFDAPGEQTGWQLRVRFTEVDVGRAARWDLFCPKHARVARPAPKPGALRISAGADKN